MKHQLSFMIRNDFIKDENQSGSQGSIEKNHIKWAANLEPFPLENTRWNEREQT